MVPRFIPKIPHFRPPSVPVAVTALGLQLTAFAVLLVLHRLLQLRYAVTLSPWLVVVLIGLFAAVLTYWAALPWWWLPIQAGFAPALLAVQALHLPPWLFLLAFLLLTSLYWTTFRTRVPLFFSGPPVWQAVAGLVPAPIDGTGTVRAIDIGSGIGGLVLALAPQRHDVQWSGIELAPLPWLISKMRARLRRSRAQFLRGDYQQCNFADFEVVFAYLSTAAMPALWQKARAEMRPGALLLSYEFAIPDQVPDLQLQPKPSGPFLYGWYQR